MRAVVTVLLIGGLLFTLGCAFVLLKETMYLRGATNHATQKQVREHVGKPRLVSATNSGEPVWVYEVRDIEPMSQSSWSTLGSWCDEYTLRFDKEGILRDWHHRSFACMVEN